MKETESSYKNFTLKHEFFNTHRYTGICSKQYDKP